MSGTMDSHECSEIKSNMTLDYINRILMEEDIDEKLSVHQGQDALQATEKPFYDILGQAYPSLPKENVINSDSQEDCHNDSTNNYHNYHDRACNGSFIGDILEPQDAHLITTGCNYEFDHFVLQFRRCVDEAKKYVPNVEKLVVDPRMHSLSVFKQTTDGTVGGQKSKHANTKSNHPRDEGFDLLEVRNSKHSAISMYEIIRNERFDSVLLCYGKHFNEVALLREMMAKITYNDPPKSLSKGYSQGKWESQGKKQRKEAVDLRALLIQCARAISSNNLPFAREVLRQIVHHSSPHGDSSQRLALCFAEGLEARLAGTGSQVHPNLKVKRTSAADMLRAFRLYITACPLQVVAYYFSSRTIIEVLAGRPRVHIIDFGIYYGFQWPSLIQHFAKREGGPPKLRITGIDVPQKGLRPSERIDSTGKRLAEYADMFNVPFRYQGIAKQWETICMEDLDIDKDEVLIINCLFRMRYLGDETEDLDSARDRVLHIMRKINPEVLILGVVNGSYNSPFFLPRFKEVLFHYSSLFDMLDSNVPSDDEERILIERDVYGKNVFNVVACEGAERIERPESYQRWQARILKAGFKQLPINQDTIRSMDDKKKHYHEDFVIDEDSGWILQGWKGRITHALSSWKAIESCEVNYVGKAGNVVRSLNNIKPRKLAT